MMLDPAVLCKRICLVYAGIFGLHLCVASAFPHHRIMHYWSKGADFPCLIEFANHLIQDLATLFGNPVMKYILLSSGNIPVDRKSKDRQILFRGTFEALSKGLAVALFPEGTSYTEPRIMQVKDGAAWAAMEYTKWAQENLGKASPLPVTVIPAAIVYTDKSKYRSNVGIHSIYLSKQELSCT